MSIRERFVKIVQEIILESDNDKKNTLLTEALGIINHKDFKKHINNDDIRYENRQMTVLDLVIFCDQDYNSNDPKRLNNPILLSLEKAIKDAGGELAPPSTRLENVSVELIGAARVIPSSQIQK